MSKWGLRFLNHVLFFTTKKGGSISLTQFTNGLKNELNHHLTISMFKNELNHHTFMFKNVK